MLLDQWTTISLVAIIIILTIIFNNASKTVLPVTSNTPGRPVNNKVHASIGHDAAKQFTWRELPDRFPAGALRTLPATSSSRLPRIQATFPTETEEQRAIRLVRQAAVKSNLTHAWNGYKAHAWLRDEVQPLSGHGQDPFGGWAATMIDALDTLWITGMRDEFDGAVAALRSVDFGHTSSDDINVFETTIRHLGGLLSAFDLSGQRVLLEKAIDLGDMLLKAFDTPNRMPNNYWRHRDAIRNVPQDLPFSTFVAEAASLTLEFTHLSQLTGDNRYYDAVQRVMDELGAQQMSTRLPGMWPMSINLRDKVFNHHGVFTIGGRADSAYEYLIKQHVLLNGATNQYADMYNKSLETMKRNVFYRPMTRNNADILLAGEVHSQWQTLDGKIHPVPRSEHLNCFAGGMVLLGAKILKSEEDIVTGTRLTEGCLWGYESMPQGIMPEIIRTMPCNDSENCVWNTTAWQRAVDSIYVDPDLDQKTLMNNLDAGITEIEDARYILRPEAIESVFIQYRVTADRTLQDRAWNMFNAIIKKTKTDIAHAALNDCTRPDAPKQDRMESFWLAETLKYFYLIFSEPDLISLDDYVFNTEAHPLRRLA